MPAGSVTVWRTTGGTVVGGAGGSPVVRSSTPVEVPGRLAENVAANDVAFPAPGSWARTTAGAATATSAAAQTAEARRRGIESPPGGGPPGGGPVGRDDGECARASRPDHPARANSLIVPATSSDGAQTRSPMAAGRRNTGGSCLTDRACRPKMPLRRRDGRGAIEREGVRMRRLRPYLAALAAALWLLAGPAHAATPPPPSASGAGTPLAPPASGAHTPLAPSASGAGTPVPPLATEGGRIVDARGRTALLQGVNWFGFETAAHVVHGLWTRDYRDVLSQIRAVGFNTIRLPFSLAALESATTTGIDFSGGKNGPLRGRTPLQALDAIIDAAAREHLLVLLDNHSATDDGYRQPLWYGDGGYTADDWIGAWRRLATRYADRPNVIGADLKNEPHGPATWGAGGPTDWRRAAERAGRAIAAIAPHWLLVVEGVEGRVAGQR